MLSTCHSITLLFGVMKLATSNGSADHVAGPDHQQLHTFTPYMFNISSDFALFPEIYSVTNPDNLDPGTRIRWQMRRWRRNPTASFLENKLLTYAWLETLDIPFAEIYYGAFATKSLGKWPQYNRNDFIETLRKIPAVGEDHSFVFKPNSRAVGIGILVMNADRWEKEEWTLEKLADRAESWLFVGEEYSNYGMQFEHLGILVQRSILPHSWDVMSKTTFKNDNMNIKTLFELQISTIFGGLAGARMYPIPMSTGYRIYMEANFCNNTLPQPAYSQYTDDKDLWEKASPIINANIQKMKEIIEAIVESIRVDWVRVDFFMDEADMLLVNEITYPSHTYQRRDCAHEWYVEGYHNKALKLTNAMPILRDILMPLNMTFEEYLDADIPGAINDDRVNDKVRWYPSRSADFTDEEENEYRGSLSHEETDWEERSNDNIMDEAVLNEVVEL